MKLVIWGETALQAESVGRGMGLRRHQFVPVADRNVDALRGVTPSSVLILPNAASFEVARHLTVCLYTNPDIPVIDLREQQ